MNMVEFKDLLKELNYDGESYDNFNNGLDVSNRMINQWIARCIDSIKKDIEMYPNSKQYFHTISSGNTKVLVECYKEFIMSTKPEDRRYSLFVSVTKNYETEHVSEVKLI